MVSSAAIIRAIAEGLRAHEVGRVVVDPVMVSTSGSRLLADDALDALKRELLPLASVVTPNIPEAEILADGRIEGEADMADAARAIAAACGSAVLVKGGHGTADANDLLVTPDGSELWLRGERIDTKNTHGTGCTLSSAIACGLAQGLPVEEAVRRAKRYVTGAIAHDVHLGRGNGPLNHMWEYGV